MASVKKNWHTSGDSDIANESRHGEMGSLLGVSCQQSHLYRRRYLRLLDGHTWKGRGTCESSDLSLSRWDG